MQFTSPIQFRPAVEVIGTKTLVGSAMSSGEWAAMPQALKDRAFFASKVEELRFLQDLRDGITDFLSGARETTVTGETALKVGSRADFVARLSAKAIGYGLGPLDPELAGTVQDVTSERRLALIFDTQIAMAEEEGNWRQGMEPAVLDQWPAQMFVREVDVKTPRRIHADNEGTVRLKTDLPFWLAMNDPVIGGFGNPYGPWGFNSGMGTRDVDRDAAVSLGLIGPTERIEPVVQKHNESLQASVRGLDPHLIDWMRQQLGSQILVDGDVVRWVGTPAQPARPSLPQPSRRPQPQAPLPTPAPAPVPVPTPIPAPRASVIDPPVGPRLADRPSVPVEPQPGIAPEAIRDAWEEIIGRYADHEEAVAISETGAHIWSGRGEASAVKVSDELAQWLDANPGATLTHNHPQGYAFSLPDYLSSARYKLGELRAVGVGRPITHRFVRGQAAWPGRAQLLAVYQSIEADAYIEISRMVRRGEMTPAEAGFRISDIIAERLAERLGMTYEQIQRTPGT